MLEKIEDLGIFGVARKSTHEGSSRSDRAKGLGLGALLSGDGGGEGGRAELGEGEADEGAAGARPGRGGGGGGGGARARALGGAGSGGWARGGPVWASRAAAGEGRRRPRGGTPLAAGGGG